MAADFDATRAIMGDIVERLRVGPPTFAGHEGADEVERLRAENAELREEAELRTIYLKPNPEIMAERDALLELLVECRQGADYDESAWADWRQRADAAIDEARRKDD